MSRRRIIFAAASASSGPIATIRWPILDYTIVTLGGGAEEEEIEELRVC